jgi:rsbT co-antagonist protein RsbR
MSDTDYTQDILEHVADMLMVLSDVGAGDYTTRLKTDLSETHPLATLFDGINEMVSSLEGEQQRANAYRKELEEKLTTIEMQRNAIRELSTPIMEVWEGVLCLPVVGVLDSQRSGEMTEELLAAIVTRRAKCAIIDITGIQVMDTGTADHFLRMAKAVRLLGARCMLTGVNPGIANTIVHMGVDLSDIATHRSLRDALRHFVGKGSSRLR